jgi:hypothetical protein
MAKDKFRDKGTPQEFPENNLRFQPEENVMSNRD